MKQVQKLLILGREIYQRPKDAVIDNVKIIQRADGTWYVELDASWLNQNPYHLAEYGVRSLKPYKMLNSALRRVFETTGATTITVIRDPTSQLRNDVI